MTLLEDAPITDPKVNPFWFLSYNLNSEFVANYSTKRVNWGFKLPSGDSLSELTFVMKYSRVKANGTKESWYETCERVVNGTVSILKDHCVANEISDFYNGWTLDQLAETMYDRMFNFKWLPPGRGLWSMGTWHVNGINDSARLQNCSFWSTNDLQNEYSSWFETFFLVCMAGVGCGFDTRGAGSIMIKGASPVLAIDSHVIEDSKEGWANSTQAIITAHIEGTTVPTFDYSEIRPQGSPISSGGFAPGPAPLKKLHIKLDSILRAAAGAPISSRTIVDVCNLIGKSVVSGGIRRTALISLGEESDTDFVNLKDWNLPENAERMGPDGWGWTSNNSVFVRKGQDYSGLVEKIKVNGEPGILWVDTMQERGRTNQMDTMVRKDMAIGTNPCAEQPLESKEFCTLVEVPITKSDNESDFVTNAFIATMYAKIVTLMAVNFEDSRPVMERNRRIGCSITGLAEFVEARNFEDLAKWADAGYSKVRDTDRILSRNLGISESIRVTSVKPSGTVSLIAGCTPGVHWPVASGQYVRTIRFVNHDPLLPILIEAGFPAEPALGDPDTTTVVSFPVLGPNIRNERQVSLPEKTQMAIIAQQWWADNMVSATFTFLPEEANTIAARISDAEDKLKVMSFLPLGEEAAYPQSPYQVASPEDFAEMGRSIGLIDWDKVYANALDSEQEGGCANDTCSIL